LWPHCSFFYDVPRVDDRKEAIRQDASFYRKRQGAEIMSGSPKDWRRIDMRYDRCAYTFFSAISLAATAIFWLVQWVLSLAPTIGERS
jgi:hypothetical protein